MELVLRTGPMDRDWLDAIARLYGPYNRKYADPGFCDRLFNQNPAGGSLHSFLIHSDGRAVGHYAVVPMDIRVRGERRRSGKGEAFVVHADHRRDTARVGERAMLGGPALQYALVEHALDRGMDVVHMIAPGEVGLIHRMTGCRATGTRHVRSTLAFGGASGQTGGGSFRSLFSRAQAPLSSLVRTLAGGHGGGVLRWSGPELTRDRLQRVAADLPLVPGWSIAIDEPALSWMDRAAGLSLLALEESMESWALVTTRAGDGRSTEVLAWRERSGTGAARRLLGAVIAEATAHSAFLAISHTAAPVAAERDRLRQAARLFLLREREQETGMFVRTRDPFYADPSHVDFTPFFYGVF